MDKRKVLICYHSSEYGGIETQILDIIKGLSNEFDIYVASKPGSLQNEYTKAGCKKFFDCYPRFEFDVGYIRNLIRIIKEEKIEVVHSHELRTGIQAMLASFVVGCPTRIYHVHTPFVFWVYKGIKRYIALPINWIANFICGNLLATKVIALTPYILNVRSKSELINPNKIVVIPNAVSPLPEYNETEFEEICNKYIIPKESYIYGYIARFSAEKSHDVLIRAFQSISIVNPKAYLLLLSDGELMNDMKNLCAELGIRDKVIFTGRVTDLEKNVLLNRMNIYVFPSKAEGFGIALIEAMSAKKPCVVSDLPVLKGVANDAVLYFKLGDIEDLKSQLFLVSNDTELQLKLIEKSFNLSKLYSVEEFNSKYKQLYLS